MNESAPWPFDSFLHRAVTACPECVRTRTAGVADPGRWFRALVTVLVAVAAAEAAAQTAIPPDPEAGAAPDTTGYRSETEFLRLGPSAAPIALAHAFVDPSSVVIHVDAERWYAERDYRVLGRRGQIVPLRPWRGTDADQDPGGDALVIVTYRFLPVLLAPRRDLHALSPPPPPPTEGAAGQTGGGLLQASTDPAAGPSLGDLLVRGSKAVRVTSGSRRDLAVDQNLRLTISGQLTQDIRVQAFLSDDNLPVVPEGNTEELRDVDRVLVQLQADHWEATLGDFVALRGGTVFGQYRRKLQGISLFARPSSFRVEGLAGSPRGRYRTVQFVGEETNQGPYFLGTGDAGANVFVVAGSERVTLDGLRMRRGADADYVIDYVRGTVTFTYRRLITAESTIVVEYEEGEGPYARTVVGGGAGASASIPLIGGTASIGVRLTEEADDPRRLRSGELSEADEEILSQAGDDETAALAPGADPVTEPGTGDYDQADENGKTIYVYAPDGGDWNVAFFYVGPGAGDYDLDTLTETGERIFVHRGDGEGGYRIGRPLPLPTRQQLVTVHAALGDTAGAHVMAEGHVSDFDRNQLSELDGDDDQGRAGRVAVSTGRRELGFGPIPLGRVGLGGFFETRDADFAPFVIHKTVFDYDVWGIADRARRAGFLEEADTEANLRGFWELGGERNRLRLAGDWGKLRHGDNLRAERSSGELSWGLGGGRGRSRLELATAEDTVDTLATDRRRHAHRISWNLFGLVVPAARYDEDRWQDPTIRGRAAGFRLRRWGATLAAAPGRPLRWTVDLEQSEADSLRSEGWQRERDARTLRADVTSPAWAGMRLDATATLRELETPDGPAQTTRLVRANLSGRWQRLGSDWHIGYGIDNNRAEVLGRRIVFVGEGQGDYDASGRFLGRGLGAYQVVTAGTDSLVATTGVDADFTWNQNFRFLGADRLWGAWSSATRIGVSGSSTADDVGPLLRLDPGALFSPEDAVQALVEFDQELTFLRHLRAWDVRLRYDHRESLDRQFADTPEDRLDRNYQGTLNWSPGQRTTVRFRGQYLGERRTTTASETSSQRSYDSRTLRGETETALRPSPGNRIAAAAESILRKDDVSGVEQLEVAIRPSARYRWAKHWSVQADLRVADVVSREPEGALRPFFYSLPGRNIETSLRVGWDPSRFLAVSVTTFARKRAERGWEYDVRMESTARF